MLSNTPGTGVLTSTSADGVITQSRSIPGFAAALELKPDAKQKQATKTGSGLGVR
jgi:hypothetical protein